MKRLEKFCLNSLRIAMARIIEIVNPISYASDWDYHDENTLWK